MRVLRYIMIFLNLLVGYFIASGLQGYLFAHSSQRKDTWLLATGFWIVVLAIVNLIWLAIHWIARRRGGSRAGQIPPNQLKSLEGDPGIEPGNYIAISTT